MAYKLVKDENYILKKEFVELMAKRHKISLARAEKCISMFLETLNNDVFEMGRSIKFKGVMHFTRITYPPRWVTNWGGEKVMSKESHKYSLMVSKDNKRNQRYFEEKKSVKKINLDTLDS